MVTFTWKWAKTCVVFQHVHPILSSLKISKRECKFSTLFLHALYIISSYIRGRCELINREPFCVLT
ncbi:hypothetical protein KC19_7G057200 [Ceratodon purpureus]|uniref:Uncharacterized protein n=1 Tax=Ceratodon purpureus TaxID=3225 RepID=A0A8T0H524_CERPU|nr:hypothetical protein KC19_7G057200 [Ceratodon purpureus]